MEEITQNEKDFVQIIQVTQFFNERYKQAQEKIVELQKSVDEGLTFQTELKLGIEAADLEIKRKEKQIEAEENQAQSLNSTIKSLKNTIYDANVQIKGLVALEQKRQETIQDLENKLERKNIENQLVQDEVDFKIPSMEREI